MSAIERITVSPDVCGGRPAIRDLRIRVRMSWTCWLLAPRGTRSWPTTPIWKPKTSRPFCEFAARQNDDPVLRSA